MDTVRSYLFDEYIANLQRGVVRKVPHKHAAYQLTVSLDGTPHRVGPELDGSRPGLIQLVGSNVLHAFDGSGGEQLLLWLAPEGTVGRRLAHTHLRDADIAVLPDAYVADLPVDELRAQLHDAAPALRVRQLLEVLLSTLAQWTARSEVALHPAVRKALRVIRSVQGRRISAEELASRVGLSRSRFLHVFKEHMGIPLRPYLQWARCLDALVLMTEGHSVTDAALAAGFTDGAHCNRVLKRYVCLSPSALSTMELHVAGSLWEPQE